MYQSKPPFKVRNETPVLMPFRQPATLAGFLLQRKPAMRRYMGIKISKLGTMSFRKSDYGLLLLA